MQVPYDDILRNVEALSRGDQLRLMADLAEYLREHTSQDASILELQGMGKEIWQDLDAQEYVDRERASWNG